MIIPTFSLGFVFGLYGGPFITAIHSSSRKLGTVLALWEGTLYFIKIGVSTFPVRK